MAERLGVYEFGEQLIKSRDLDPVYVVLYQADLPIKQLQKFLIGYWNFYHMGTASWIVDQPDYWQAMMTAAGSKDYPRSSERRHYRGRAAIESVTWLKQRGVTPLFSGFCETTTLGLVVQYVKTWRGYGSWISFKVADMLERLNLYPVTFTPSDVFKMYDSPEQGARDMAEHHGPATEPVTMWAYEQLIGMLGHLKAPPSLNRTINAQEVETILCKYHSHLSGKYTIGKDIHEVHHSLQRFNCQTSQRLLKAGKDAGLW